MWCYNIIIESKPTNNTHRIGEINMIREIWTQEQTRTLAFSCAYVHEDHVTVLGFTPNNHPVGVNVDFDGDVLDVLIDNVTYNEPTYVIVTERTKYLITAEIDKFGVSDKVRG